MLRVEAGEGALLSPMEALETMELPIVSVQKWIQMLISRGTVRWKRQNDLVVEVETTEEKDGGAK